MQTEIQLLITTIFLLNTTMGFVLYWESGESSERFPANSVANLEKLAATIPVPSSMIDDQTAIKVTDDIIEVVSEGNWKLFKP